MTKDASKASLEKPLLGAQLCCTSIAPEYRSYLAQWAEELGGDHTLDLTSDVTHLLVGSTDSKKYQYVAREREDVKVLLPEFIEAVRELWMDDQPIDFNALEAQYRCPTLFGLKVCITGFDDISFRNQLAADIVQHGGLYSGDLTKDVTHLIAQSPVGKKYEYATAWGLKVVSIKWYKDSQDRGMQLDETKYHPTLPPENQGIGAWTRNVVKSPRAMKRPRLDQPEANTTRKLRRTASARFGTQQSDMWDVIVRPQTAASTASATNLPRVASETTLSHASAPPRPVEHLSDDELRPTTENAPSLVQQELHVRTGVFSGRHFLSRGFDEKRKTILTQHLLGHDGTLHDTIAKLRQEAQSQPQSCFVIVPHQIDNDQLAVLERSRGDLAIVTELWLEYCISVKVFVSPDDYPLGMPAPTIKVPAVAKLIVNASGFAQIQTLHISKIVQKLGARYEEKFTAQTSVLICDSSNQNPQKISHAQAWKIPVVSERWLWQMIREARLPAFSTFLLVNPAETSGRSRQNLNNPTLGASKESLQYAEEKIEKSSAGGAHVEGQLKPHPPDQGGSTPQALNHSIHFGGDTENIPIGDKGAEPRARKAGSKVTRVLDEIHPNVPSRMPSPLKEEKKRLFRTFDGANSDQGTGMTDTESVQPESSENAIYIKPDPKRELEKKSKLKPRMSESRQPVSHSTLINEFLAVKAAAETAKKTDNTSGSKKLLGRALSGLSNSSRKSNDQCAQSDHAREPLSRASSIGSNNTDGLGMPLSMMSRIPSDLRNQKHDSIQQSVDSSITGNSARNTANRSTLAADANLDGPGMALSDFQRALTALSTSQLPQPPSPTQEGNVTYAESDGAAALKAHLAEKRRQRVKMAVQKGDPEPVLSREDSEEKRQQAWREREAKADVVGIEDDAAIVGFGRRTRGREKALSKLLGDVDVEHETMRNEIF